MIARTALLLLAALATSTAASAQDLRIALTGPASPEVRAGRSFEVVVTREWPNHAVPEPFDPATLDASAREEDTTRTAGPTTTVETRRLRLWLFEPGTVTLPELAFAATTGNGTRLTARSEPLVLTVTSALPTDDPGRAELPHGLLPLPTRWGPTVLRLALATILLGLGAVGFFRLRARWLARRPAPPPTPPHLVALARLAALRPDADTAPAQCHHGTAETLRQYLAARFQVPAPEMTREEIAAATRTLPAHAELCAVLDRCDLVKFADHTPGAETGRATLDAAVAFVQATAPAAAQGNGTP